MNSSSSPSSIKHVSLFSCTAKLTPAIFVTTLNSISIRSSSSTTPPLSYLLNCPNRLLDVTPAPLRPFYALTFALFYTPQLVILVTHPSQHTFTSSTVHCPTFRTVRKNRISRYRRKCKRTRIRRTFNFNAIPFGCVLNERYQITEYSIYVLYMLVKMCLCFRLFWNIPFVALIYYTPKLINVNGIIDIPIYYYGILILILSIHDVSLYYCV